MAKDLLQSARYIEGSLGPASKWVRRQKRVRDAETAPRAQKTANSRKVHLLIHNAQPQMCSSANKQKVDVSFTAWSLRHRTRLTPANVTYVGHWWSPIQQRLGSSSLGKRSPLLFLSCVMYLRLPR